MQLVCDTLLFSGKPRLGSLFSCLTLLEPGRHLRMPVFSQGLDTETLVIHTPWPEHFNCSSLSFSVLTFKLKSSPCRAAERAQWVRVLAVLAWGDLSLSPPHPHKKPGMAHMSQRPQCCDWVETGSLELIGC